MVPPHSKVMRHLGSLCMHVTCEEGVNLVIFPVYLGSPLFKVVLLRHIELSRYGRRQSLNASLCKAIT